MFRGLAIIIGYIFLIAGLISAIVYILERYYYYNMVGARKTALDDSTKKLAIITGASSGLGWDYAHFLAKNEVYGVDELIVIARREGRLKMLEEDLAIPTTVYTLDMTKQEEMDEFKRFLEDKLKRENVQIKYLINSAGSGFKGPSLELGAEKENSTADINCKAQVSMIHIVANLMKAEGNIIQIASVAGLSPIYHLNAYSASKAFIYNYCRGLRIELLKKGINLTTVCPYWIIDTEFMSKAGVGRGGVILPTKSKKVVKKSVKDASRGYALSTPGFVATVDRLVGGLIPDEILFYLTKFFV